MTPAERLRALHERIAELEGRGARPRTGSPWWALLPLVALAFLLGRWVTVRAEPVPLVRVEYGPPRFAPPSPGTLRVAPPPSHPFEADGPVLHDVNGDGARDLVARFWFPGAGQTKMYVAALDRKTLAPIWTSGPFESYPEDRGDLVARGADLVFSDGARKLHVLDAATGAVRGVISAGKIEALRAIDEGSGPRLVVIVESDQPQQRPVLEIDVAKLVLVPTPLDGFLSGRWCVTDFTRPCEIHPDDDEVAAIAALEGPVAYASHLVRVVDRGAKDAGIWRYPYREKEWREHALRWSGKKPAWHVPLAATRPPWPEDTFEHDKKGVTAIDARAVYHVYPAKNGRYRLTRRDLVTGAATYDVAIEGLTGDDAVVSFAADEDTLFVYDGSSIHVLEADSGLRRRWIDRI